MLCSTTVASKSNMNAIARAIHVKSGGGVMLGPHNISELALRKHSVRVEYDKFDSRSEPRGFASVHPIQRAMRVLKR